MIMDELGLNPEQVGLISTATLVVTTIGFIVWGYLYDKYSRVLLTTVAGLIWTLTTWLSALSRQFTDFFVTRASTGIDDAATPGMYALLSDYFPPERRSTIMGLMNVAPQAGFLIGGLIGTFLGLSYGWRTLFFVTGGLGIIGALLVYFLVRDVRRGKSETESAGLASTSEYRIDRKVAAKLITRPSMLLLGLQGFFGVFPWNILYFWIFTYLEKERLFGPELIAVWLIMSLATMIVGIIVAGIIGDFLFKKNRKGRVILSALSVFVGALLFYLLFTRPLEDTWGFLFWSIPTAFVIPMAGPNVVATVFDITEPEARSTGLSILRWFENVGSAFAPLIVGVLWYRVFGVLGTASLVVGVSAWVVCGTILAVIVFRIDNDIQRIRKLLVQRAEAERKRKIEE
jgi:MFS family permease